MSAKPLVTIIIVTRNSQHFITACLQSIFTSTYQQFEIIIIDNASTDKTLTTIQTLPRQRANILVHESSTNIGSAGGRNLGVKNSKGKYILFLDPDTEIDKHALNHFVQFMQKYPYIGAAQGKLLNLERPQYYDSAGELLDPLGFLSDRAQGTRDVGQLDLVAPMLAGKTAALFARKTAFDHIGGFDTDYFFLLEDGDFDWRLWLHGFPVVFLPQAVIYHGFNTNKKNLQKDLHYSNYTIRYYGSRNYVFTLIKNLSLKKLILILPPHLLSWVIMAFSLLLKGNLQSSWYIIKGLSWNLTHIRFVVSKRHQLQTQRVISDDQLGFLFTSRLPFHQYLLKIKSYAHD